jgi:hypothetical protein
MVTRALGQTRAVLESRAASGHDSYRSKRGIAYNSLGRFECSAIIAPGTSGMPNTAREGDPVNNKLLRGVIHGNVIELDESTGMSDGQRVEVVVRPVFPEGKQPGEGFLRTEGALADDTEWDAIMEQVQQSRRQERRPQWDES